MSWFRGGRTRWWRGRNRWGCEVWTGDEVRLDLANASSRLKRGRGLPVLAASGMCVLPRLVAAMGCVPAVHARPGSDESSRQRPQEVARQLKDQVGEAICAPRVHVSQGDTSADTGAVAGGAAPADFLGKSNCNPAVRCEQESRAPVPSRTSVDTLDVHPPVPAPLEPAALMEYAGS